MTTKHAITGDFSTHVGEAKGLKVFLYSSRPWRDTDTKQIVVGPSKIDVDKQGKFKISLPAVDDLQFEIRATWTVRDISGTQTYESGWFYVTAPADLSTLAEDATSEPVTPTEGGLLSARMDTLSNDLNGVAFQLGGKAPLSHLHVISDVDGLQEALDSAGGGGPFPTFRVNGTEIYESENTYDIYAAQIPEFVAYADVWASNVFTNVTFSGTGVMVNDPMLDSLWNDYNAFLAEFKGTPEYPDDITLQMAGITQYFANVYVNVAELMKRSSIYSTLAYGQAMQDSSSISILQNDIYNLTQRVAALEGPQVDG